MIEWGTGIHVPSRVVEACGALVALAPLFLAAIRGHHDAELRRGLLASVLVLVVLFNHRSEYCTFVIAAVGVGVWVSTREPDSALVALIAVAFAGLGPVPLEGGAPSGITDWLITPRAFHPLRLVGISALWLLMQRDVWARFAVRRQACSA